MPKYIHTVIVTVKNKTMPEGSFESVYGFDHEGILGLNKHKNQSNTKKKVSETFKLFTSGEFMDNLSVFFYWHFPFASLYMPLVLTIIMHV